MVAGRPRSTYMASRVIRAAHLPCQAREFPRDHHFFERCIACRRLRKRGNRDQQHGAKRQYNSAHGAKPTLAPQRVCERFAALHVAAAPQLIDLSLQAHAIESAHR